MQKMHTHTHTHAHTVQTDGSEGQRGLTEIFWEEKCFELTFEGRESGRVPDVLEEIVPDVGAKVWQSAKAMGFAVETLDFVCMWACICACLHVCMHALCACVGTCVRVFFCCCYWPVSQWQNSFNIFLMTTISCFYVHGIGHVLQWRNGT